MSNRPVIKIVAKPKERGSKGRPFVAVWDRGDFMSGSLEKGWKLIDPEGNEVTFGRDGDHWLNCYDERKDGPAYKAKEDREAMEKYGDEPGGGDFGDSEIPFAPLDGRLA
jgi:hypothetical protein